MRNSNRRRLCGGSFAQTARLKRFDGHDPPHRLDRASDLRRHYKAAWKLYLDLVAAAEHQHHADFAVALLRPIAAVAAGGKPDWLKAFSDALDWRVIAQEHAQPHLHFGRRRIERLNRLN